MRYIILIITAIITISASGKGKITYHENEVDDGYNFVLYQPDSTSVAKPLIITLHSRSSSGNNLKDVDYFGTIDAIESGMEIDTYVIAPQATGNNWDADKIMKDVYRVVTDYNIDTCRIYAIGMSMGGNGVADLAAANPDKIAAAIVLAGGLTNGSVSNLNKIPLWVIRGMDDREEAIARTDQMIEKMQSQADGAPRLIYSKVKGLNHRQHERILYMKYFYEWLMSHNLKDPDRASNPTINVTAKLLKNSYKGLNIREESATKRKRAIRRPHRRFAN